MAYSKSEYHFFKGKAKWAKTMTPNKFGDFTITLYPDAESLANFNKLKTEKGLLNQVRKDEDGYFVVFKRPTQKMMRGKVVGFAPPEVLSPDGTTPLRDQLIGNGSDVTVKIELYAYTKPADQGKGYACRLQSIRVDNLVPFIVNRDFDPDQEKLVRDLAEQPKPAF